MQEPTLNYVRCPGAKAGAAAAEDAATHRMAYWDWAAGDPAAASHVIVCVHGLSRQGRDFDTLARALLPNARVVCPDVAGRGASDWLADPMAYQVAQYAADMLALLAQLHAEHPIARLDWVGTSMGGLIGLALCGQPGLPLPVPVERLVLNDVGPAIEWQALERIGRYLGQAGNFPTVDAAAAAMWAVSESFGPHSPEAWLALSRPMLRAQGVGYTLHYDPAIAVPFRALTKADASQGQATLWRLYDQVSAHTLLLRGAESDLLSAATAEAMSQRGPKARLVEFAGVGHAPTLQAPDQVAAVCDFLLAGGDRGLA